MPPFSQIHRSFFYRFSGVGTPVRELHIVPHHVHHGENEGLPRRLVVSEVEEQQRPTIAEKVLRPFEHAAEWTRGKWSGAKERAEDIGYVQTVWIDLMEGTSYSR